MRGGHIQRWSVSEQREVSDRWNNTQRPTEANRLKAVSFAKALYSGLNTQMLAMDEFSSGSLLQGENAIRNYLLWEWF